MGAFRGIPKTGKRRVCTVLAPDVHSNPKGAIMVTLVMHIFLEGGVHPAARLAAVHKGACWRAIGKQHLLLGMKACKVRSEAPHLGTFALQGKPTHMRAHTRTRVLAPNCNTHGTCASPQASLGTHTTLNARAHPMTAAQRGSGASHAPALMPA